MTPDTEGVMTNQQRIRQRQLQTLVAALRLVNRGVLDFAEQREPPPVPVVVHWPKERGT